MSVMDGDVAPGDVCAAGVDALSVGSGMILGIDVVLYSADALPEADAGADEGSTLIEIFDVLIEIGIDSKVEDFCSRCDGLIVDCCPLLTDVESTFVFLLRCVSLVAVRAFLLITRLIPGF